MPETAFYTMPSMAHVKLKEEARAKAAANSASVMLWLVSSSATIIAVIAHRRGGAVAGVMFGLLGPGSAGQDTECHAVAEHYSCQIPAISA